MKKLAIAAALLTSLNAFAAEEKSDFDFAFLGGYDTANGSAIALEAGYKQFIVGVQGYNTLTESNPHVEELPELGYVATEQKDYSIYGGYRLDNGIAFKAGATMSNVDAGTTLNLPLLGNKSAKGDNSVVRPFVGLGYDVTDNWNVNLHYTFAAKQDVKMMDGDMHISDMDIEHKYQQNVSLMVGYRF
ncbi:porin family protein [Vibrio sp. SCSIO 43136]|uniref:porin family protein n=1 Tax=Vibrio sp. SCSIO 43136 TaxID=2819101 RepID=UPI002076619E|nr:porin family protein [Vibrio sp. SCSIO 43136]USD67779.1 hypothetical protein J4N39_16455 [Vibrio sp. SCSIO 43136]